MATASDADDAAFYADIRAPDGSFKFLVNGEWRVSSSGATCDSLNPSRANAAAHAFQACTRAEVDEAYAAAKAAHKAWAKVPSRNAPRGCTRRPR